MSEERKQIDYTVVCINEFAHRHNLKIKEAFQYLFQYKAMQLFYNSQTFDKLTDIETGLYLESPAYIYGIFQDERNFDCLIQAEI